jgi:hypothetical protein
LGCQEFNKYTNSKSTWWRFTYCYGGPALIYLLGVLVSLLSVWFLFQSTLLNLTVLWVPSWALLWGATGGVLYGLWWLWQHVSRRELRKAWYVWYLILPPASGAILGAIAYLIFMAGFVASTGNGQVQQQYFIMLLSALAGFSSRWAVQLLENITKLIKVGG